MTKKQLNHFDILKAKNAYAEGLNVIQFLRSQMNSTINTSEIIEMSYDLQSGTYIDYIKNNMHQALLYTQELAEILSPHIKSSDSLLDIGTGELTTLSLVLGKLIKKPKSVYAFDISWSRIFKGLEFAKEKMGLDYGRLKPFVADINQIPLLDKSINIITSSHALEPNGACIKELMSELFRIAIDKLILFEPCYEINTEEGKQLMNKNGYVKNIDGVVKELGGKVLNKIVIKNVNNPLNPTVCFVCLPPISSGTIKTGKRVNVEENIFSVPGTNIPLKVIDNFYYSKQTGMCYPILKDIPILKYNSAILATLLDE